MRSAARKVVNETAERIYNESQRRVPVDTGNLKSSARLEPAQGDETTAQVGYGGTAAGYALVIHETHRSGSKYLEEPAREEVARFVKDVREAVRNATR